MEPLDLRRHDDLFTAIDTLTRASAQLAVQDQPLAYQVSRVIAGLAALAEAMEEAAEPPPPAGDDLTAVRRPPAVVEEGPEEIVDVLTGEKIG